jgi:TRAP-type uncharacterized transport system fused permease subunit
MQIQIPHLDPDQERQRKQLDEEMRRYTLVGDGGWLTWVKVAVALLLGAWNAHLFVSTIPGWMGILTAVVAIHLEGTALYCVHNYPRSIGTHKKCLGGFAIILGVFSLTHAVFAIVRYTGYARGSEFVEFYSNVLAMPIIVILLSVSMAVLTMTHPKAAIIAKLAIGKLESMTNRSETLIEENRVRDANELMQLKAHLFQIETETKKALIPIVRERIDVEKDLVSQVNAIEDGETRRQVINALDAVTKKQLPPGP